MGTNSRRGPILWRRALVVAGVVLLAAIAAGGALSRTSDQVRAGARTPSPSPTANLTVGWGGGEGHLSCVYDPQDHTVSAAITLDGHAPRRDTVTVTVTAYADENTSQPVGSRSRTVPVDGTVHIALDVTVPVEQPPLVDIDGETACGISVDD